MFRNESGYSLPSRAALTEQQILAMLDALIKGGSIVVPLNRKITEYIAACANQDLLKPLAEHQNPLLRCAVAANLKLPEELVWKLACDSDFRVRARLAENQNLASFLLETLAEDEDERVAQRANRSLDKQNSDQLSNRVIHWMFGSFAVKQTG